MNLLGGADDFQYPTFAHYVGAIHDARPAVNVAALVGHTALRNNHMDRLDRTATNVEIEAMRAQLCAALDRGALGLSSGLAYGSANAATTEEVLALAQPLASAGEVYATHMRTETAAILDAMEETFQIGRLNRVPVIISHLKCAGIDNWGRSSEVLHRLEAVRATQQAGCDCYPYAAGSSTSTFNTVFKEYFGYHPPARSCVESRNDGGFRPGAGLHHASRLFALRPAFPGADGRRWGRP